MDEILKQNLYKPKYTKPKKVVIDFAEAEYNRIKNFIVPNKRSYNMLPKENNDKRLDDFVHTNLYMNHFTNTSTFYERSHYYRCNALAYVGEYFCRDYDFDGIFMEVKEAEEPLKTFSIIEDDRLFIYSYDDYAYLESSLKEPEKSSCKSAMAVIRMLSRLKQYERDALFLNGLDVSPYSCYLCYLHIMQTTIEAYNRAHNKVYLVDEMRTLLTFDELHLSINALSKYLDSEKNELKINNRKNLISTILYYFYSYALGTHIEPLTLEKFMANGNKIIKEYKKLFGDKQIAKDLLKAIESYSPSLLAKTFDEKRKEMEEFCIKYSLWYLNIHTDIMKKEDIAFVHDVIEINGYAFITYLIDSVFMYNAKSESGFHYYLELYNKHYKYNNLDIAASISQIIRYKKDD